jgi:hypothetical protein
MQVLSNCAGPTIIGGIVGGCVGAYLHRNKDIILKEITFIQLGAVFGAVSQLALALFSEFGHKNRLASQLLLIGSVSAIYIQPIMYMSLENGPLISKLLIKHLVLNTIFTNLLIMSSQFSRTDMLARAIGLR